MEKKEFEMSHDIEKREDLHVLNIDVTCIAEKGLGYGEGTISSAEVDTDVLEDVLHTIDSDDILVAIDQDKEGNLIDDDGCGDGREVANIYEGTKVRERSLHRAKIFGGGATMAVAALVGQGKKKDKNLQDLFSTAIGDLAKHNLPFGAHTDNHAHGDNCGCGAIDKAPRIIENVSRYEEQIAAAAALILGDDTGIQQVIDNFKNYHKAHEGQAYRGSGVMEEIIEDGKIVKELSGAHQEVAIVLNMVPGYTIDQQKIRTVSDGHAQVFGVDVPRLTTVSERLYPEDKAAQKKAFISMVVYTLATAGTLTKGDLPVFVVSPQE
jgi:hypothetical protein